MQTFTKNTTSQANESEGKHKYEKKYNDRYSEKKNDVEKHAEKHNDSHSVETLLTDRKELWATVSAITKSQVTLCEAEDQLRMDNKTLKAELETLRDENKKLINKISDIQELLFELLKRTNVQQPIADQKDQIYVHGTSGRMMRR